MKKLIDFNEQNIKQINDIREKRGMTAFAEVVRTCIAETHKREFPSYAPTASRVNLSPEEEARERLERKELDKKVREEAIRAKCLKFIDDINAQNPLQAQYRHPYLKLSDNELMVHRMNRRGETGIGYALEQLATRDFNWELEQCRKSY